MTINISAQPSPLANPNELASVAGNLLLKQQQQKQFAKAIESNNAVEVESLFKNNPEFLTTALPNGELPLQFAVQKKSLAVVTLLVQNGQDPAKKDDQQLSAIDYARLQNNQEALVEMLRIVVPENAQNVRAILQNPANLKAAREVIGKINTEIANLEKTKILDYLNVAINNLEAEYASHKETQSRFSFFTEDKQSQRPTLIINRLLNDPTVQQCLTTNGQTLLHVAVAIGHTKLLELCLQSKFYNINAKNLSGHTPIEYAAASANMSFIHLLAKEGADFRIVDPSTKLTPFALIGASAYERNPLSISKLEGFFFLSSLALWAAPLMMDKGDISSEFLLQTALMGTQAVFMFGTLINSYGNFKKFFVKNVLHTLILTSYPAQASLIGKLFHGLDLALLSKKTFNNLKQCWRNRQINPAKAVFKAVVTTGPLIFSIKEKLANLNIGETFFQFPESQRAYIERFYQCQTERSSDINNCAQLAADISDKCFTDRDSEACSDVENLYKQYWGIASKVSTKPVECINAANELGIDVNASMAEARQAKRLLAAQYHPDKYPEHASKMEDIGAAFNTFKDCV